MRRALVSYKKIICALTSKRWMRLGSAARQDDLHGDFASHHRLISAVDASEAAQANAFAEFVAFHRLAAKQFSHTLHR